MKITGNNMKFLKPLILFLLISISFTSCKDDPVPTPDPDDSKPKASALTLKINQFIKDAMTDVYLWYKTMPTIDIKYELDSKAYFSKLLASEDKWSFVTDDVKKLENSLQGKETTYGWSLAFGKFNDTQKIFALVEAVYPGSPADKAGIKRGDMIYKLNGADITDATYMQLYTSTGLSCTFGQYITGSGITNSREISLAAIELTMNPVHSRIIEHGGKKIGYLYYDQFITNYNTSIDTVLQTFKNNQIIDVVLDLRYNPGGQIGAAQYLCSSLAPIDVVNDKKVLVKYQWNDKYQAYWESKSNYDQLEIRFINTTGQKMNLQKLYVLTGNGTASASELLITGLKPYMSVTTIGEKTYGKYTASITLKPEDFYDTPSSYADFNTWGVQPIILKYANSQGVTDFKNGFTPDIPVDDDLLSTIPLGDKREALLKTAIEQITGVPVPTKSAVIRPEYRIFDRGSSRFDANKRELLIDNFDKRIFKH